jgi:hypothetical protein
MPIGTIESNKQVDYKLVYGRADGMPNSLESMVVCDVMLPLEPYISTTGVVAPCPLPLFKFEASIVTTRTIVNMNIVVDQKNRQWRPARSSLARGWRRFRS